MARLVYVLGTCAAIAGFVHLLSGTFTRTGGESLPPMERRILEAARNKAEDPDLGRLFERLNTEHFGGALPDARVMWESELDRLDVGDYRLNGMTDGTVILLKPALRDDEADARRTLCHEMVHVRLLAAGDRSTTHDAAFQAELGRIFEQGCFEAILAPQEEQAALKAWIDAERSRLDGARLQARADGAAAKSESEVVERTVAELNQRIRLANAAGAGWPSPGEIERAERRKTDAENRVLAYNAVVERLEREQTQFDEAVRRYNLMRAYPDGLAEDRAKGLIR